MMPSHIDFPPRMSSLALGCVHSGWHIAGTQRRCVQYYILPFNSTQSPVSVGVATYYSELVEGQILILTSVLLRPAALKAASLSAKPPKGNRAVVTSAARSRRSPGRGSHWGSRCMAALSAELFFFPGCLGLQPTPSLHCLEPEPLLSPDLFCHELEEGPGRVELEARGKDWGISTVGSAHMGSELRLPVSLQSLELGQGSFIDILGALLKGGTDLQDI